METNSISASVHGSPNLQIPPQADVRKWKSQLIYSATHYEGSVDWNPMEEYLCTQAAVIQLNAFPLRRFKSGLSKLCLLPLYPSPSQFSSRSTNELSKLANGGKWSFFIFCAERLLYNFRGVSQDKLSF